MMVTGAPNAGLGGALGRPQGGFQEQVDPERQFLDQRMQRRQRMGWEGRGDVGAALERFRGRQPELRSSMPERAPMGAGAGGGGMDRMAGAVSELYKGRSMDNQGIARGVPMRPQGRTMLRGMNR